jgi:hypothetical protein
LEEAEALGYAPRFNVAPTQQIPVLRRTESGPHLGLMRWGLVPPWVDSLGKRAPLFNAQVETVAVKPTFRSIIKNMRCLVPTDGFYEWQAINGKKQPHYFGLTDHKPYFFAGLWQSWHKSDPPLESWIIPTTRANELLRQLHDRMPVILSNVANGTRFAFDWRIEGSTMYGVKRQPIRCLSGQWQFLHGNEWIEVNSFAEAELMATAEPLCYAVINKQVTDVTAAPVLGLAAQAWLMHYRGGPTRMYRLCIALADVLRERFADSVDTQLRESLSG